MGSTTAPRVFRRLTQERDLADRVRLLSKATLTELSHVLENAVIEHDLPGAVFTGFQESGNWLRALARYDRLVAPRARTVAVFAAGNVASLGSDDIIKVRLDASSPLVEEWFLIVLTPTFSAALLGEDTGHAPTEEADRLFETIWTFDADVIERVARFVQEEVATFDPATAERIATSLERYPPVRSSGPIHDEVMGSVVSALEGSRERLRHAAEMEQQVADQLRELDRTKNSFLSAVSHEMRTPLTVVKGMADTLQRLREQLPIADRAQLEDALCEHTDRLVGLLDDLLDVDRLMRGRVDVGFTTFEVLPVLQAAITESHLLERVRLDAPSSLVVTADAVQVRRIAVNLLENVRKYAPEGPVTVRARRLGTRGARLEVEDSGPGIAPGELEEVFRPFHRSNDDHPSPGTGVGLALVAEFAQLHGGRAWAQPGSGGAHIVVELPGPAGPTAEQPQLY